MSRSFCHSSSCWQYLPCDQHSDRLQKLMEGLKDPLARVEHADPSRSGVATTAQLVCAMRAQESARPEGERLFEDSCAATLAGPGMLMLTTGKTFPSVNETVVLRTKAIDDEINRFTTQHAGKGGQLVIIGAGYDCRAFRLASLSKLRVFELDFKSVLNEKLQLLKAGGFSTCCLSHWALGCDLSQAGWEQQLVRHGEFRVEEPTLYLLEGFCGYLKEAELLPLLKTLATLTSGPTTMITTWIAPGFQSHTSLHQFYTATPGKFLGQAGWHCYEELSIGDIAAKYQRTTVVQADNRSFFLTLSRPQ